MTLPWAFWLVRWSHNRSSFTKSFVCIFISRKASKLNIRNCQLESFLSEASDLVLSKFDFTGHLTHHACTTEPAEKTIFTTTSWDLVLLSQWIPNKGITAATKPTPTACTIFTRIRGNISHCTTTTPRHVAACSAIATASAKITWPLIHLHDWCLNHNCLWLGLNHLRLLLDHLGLLLINNLLWLWHINLLNRLHWWCLLLNHNSLWLRNWCYRSRCYRSGSWCSHLDCFWSYLEKN